jgi:hypothetical protein
VISFVLNNQLDASNIQNLFRHKTPHVSGIFFVHHQELSAVLSVIVMFHARYVTASNRVRLELQYQLSSVQQMTPDDGHRRCPKHVEFYDEINSGYLMHLAGCFIRRKCCEVENRTVTLL